jgi:hypothetical protein
MAWIRSESGLPRHPKTLHLMKLMDIQLDQAIGRIHMLWWWCLDYAIDGDLSKQEAKVVEHACSIPLRTLIRAGFVDSRPYRRIHDWWENQGAYLRSRYHKQPEIWQRIENLYQRGMDISKDESSNSPRISPVRRTDVQTYGRTDKQDVRTDVEKKDARAGSPGGSPLAPGEIMTPEEMKAIRIKNMGDWK